MTATAPPTRCAFRLQILNHLQDCATDMRTLDRCYLPQTLMRHFGVTPRDLLGPAETPALRRIFITVLDRVDRLNLAAEELPDLVRSRRLRAETMFICRLAVRLADRLGQNRSVGATGGADQGGRQHSACCVRWERSCGAGTHKTGRCPCHCERSEAISPAMRAFGRLLRCANRKRPRPIGVHRRLSCFLARVHTGADVAEEC